MAFITFVFLTAGKSFVWDDDGPQEAQHVLYAGKYWNDFFSSLAAGEFSFPTWDSNYGLGGDNTSLTLNFDPFSAIFQPFASEDNIEAIRCVSLILKIYVTGVAFLIFCKIKNPLPLGAVLGAVSYAFCGYILYVGFRHPYFINPLIYFPLLLRGATDIIQNRSPFLFVASVWLLGTLSYYFLFICSVGLLVYVILELWVDPASCAQNNDSGRYTFRIIAGGLGWYVLGVALSAYYLIPSIAPLFSTNRVGGSSETVPLLYDLNYYFKLIISLDTSSDIPFWGRLGLPSLVVPSLAACIVRRNHENKKLLIACGLCLCAFCVPCLGYILNGFGYVSNRWCFMAAFVASLVIATKLKDLVLLSRRSFLGVVLISAVYVSVQLALMMLIGLASVQNIASVLVFSTGFIALVYVARRNSSSYRICGPELPAHFRTSFGNTRMSTVVSPSVFIVLATTCLIECAGHAYALFSAQGSAYIDEFISLGSLEDILEDGGSTLLQKSADDSYRVDSDVEGNNYNYGLTNNLKTINSYSSTLNSGITEFYQSLGNADQDLPFRIKGAGGQTALMRFLGVKHVVLPQESFDWVALSDYAPVMEENGLVVYENMYPLPIAMTTTRVFSEEEYLAASPIQRSRMLLEGVVVASFEDEGENSVYNYESDETNLYSVDELSSLLYTLGNIDVDLSEGRVIVYEAGSSINFPGVSPNNGSAIAVQFEGLDYSTFEHDSRDPLDRVSSVQLYWEGDQSMYSTYSPSFIYYSGPRDYLAYLYDKTYDVFNELNIVFAEPGVYEFESLSIHEVSNNEMLYSDLRTDQIEDFRISDNTIEFSVNSSEDTFALLTIPDSSGWSATVNGKNEEILDADIAFMSISIPAGNSKVVLTYSTPGLALGTAISLLSLVGIVAIRLLQNGRNLTKLGELLLPPKKQLM